MKRTLLACILTAALVFSLLPVSALGAGAEDYSELLSNFNTAAVSNDPEYYPLITVKKDTRVDVVTTYHWNNGQGKTPGTITILEDDAVLGTWQAAGRSSSGVVNALWDAFPGVTLHPGHEYVIRDSDEATWSWNQGSRGAGFFSLRGSESTSASSSTSSGSSSPAGTTAVSGYTCSNWAAGEVSKAVSYNLIPSGLSGGDLTKPINRADFADVSVRTYEKMTGSSAPAGSFNPFTDTTNAQVLKAYGPCIVNGTSATTFAPGDNLTREQASTMLTRTYKKIVLPGWTLNTDGSFSLSYTAPAAFADQGSISSFAQSSVSFMAAKGIVNGVGGNKFAPKNTVTRQEALAIAVRMVDNLDTTPQQGTVTPPAAGGSEGAAQGTLSTGNFSVTFQSAQKGQAVLTQDGKGYDLLLTDEPTGTVSVSFPADAPADGTENVVYLGIPYVDDSGRQDFEIFPLDTTYAGGRVTATADLSQYANAIEDAAYSGETATGKKDYQAEFARKQAAAVGSGVNVKIAIYIFCETEYLIKSNAGHFQIYVPISSYNKMDEAVKGKINRDDAKRIVEDMESVLSYYQGRYKIKRTNWPMKVVLDTGNDGQYGSGRMKLNWTSLSNGYGRDMTSSLKMYQTISHELFHFVQREYAPVALSQSWFDEASASYMGIQLGYARCGNMDTAILNENYAADAEAQYQGIAPMDVATLGWFDFLHAGYGRASFIDYLMKTFGSDFLKKYYEQGVTLAGLQTEARLENLTGKSLGELAEDFYCKLVLEKDTILSILAVPSDIFERSLSGGDDGDASLDEVRTTWSLSGSGGTESTTIKVPRYGAYFTALDMTKIDVGVQTFTLTVPTADCAARLIAIKNNNSVTQYDVQKVYKPGADGKFEQLPVDGTMYLLMMINTTGSWGWTVSERLDVTYTRLSQSGAYPTNINEVPESFSGTLSLWKGGAEGTHTASIPNARLEVTTDGGYLHFDLTSSQLPEGHIYAAGRGFFSNSGAASATTSGGQKLLAQLEAGKYVDRTKGPKPTPEQIEEMGSSPFGFSIEGDKTTNRIRVFLYDRFGRFYVFEGTGSVDNGFYYSPEIVIKHSVSEPA